MEYHITGGKLRNGEEVTITCSGISFPIKGKYKLVKEGNTPEGVQVKIFSIVGDARDIYLFWLEGGELKSYQHCTRFFIKDDSTVYFNYGGWFSWPRWDHQARKGHGEWFEESWKAYADPYVLSSDGELRDGDICQLKDKAGKIIKGPFKRLTENVFSVKLPNYSGMYLLCWQDSRGLCCRMCDKYRIYQGEVYLRRDCFFAWSHWKSRDTLELCLPDEVMKIRKEGSMP